MKHPQTTRKFLKVDGNEYRGLRQKKPTVLVLESILDVAHRWPRASISIAKSSSPCIALEMLADDRAEGLIPPGKLAAEYSIRPSAVFSHPIRYPLRYPAPVARHAR